jgi:hypothetical protein
MLLKDVFNNGHIVTGSMSKKSLNCKAGSPDRQQ